MIEFPDINVLVALIDRLHFHHQVAKDWFEATESIGWATCALTQNGLVRTLANPINKNAQLSSYDAAEILCRSIVDAGNNHEFWTDSVSFCDASIFDLT